MSFNKNVIWLSKLDWTGSRFIYNCGRNQTSAISRTINSCWIRWTTRLLNFKLRRNLKRHPCHLMKFISWSKGVSSCWEPIFSAIQIALKSRFGTILFLTFSWENLPFSETSISFQRWTLIKTKCLLSTFSNISIALRWSLNQLSSNTLLKLPMMTIQRR